MVVGFLLFLFTLPTLVLAADPAGIKKLVQDLGNPKYAVREEASRQLMELGEQAGPYLAEAINSSDPEIRLRAQRIMSRLGLGDLDQVDPQMLAKVEALLEPVVASDHPNLQRVVELGRSATPALAAIAKRDDTRKSIYAMIALTRNGDSRAYPVLAGLYSSPNLTRHLPGYVAGIKDQRMLFHLIKTWQLAGAQAPAALRSQLERMTGQTLGDDPAAWMKWYVAKYGEK